MEYNADKLLARFIDSQQAIRIVEVLHDRGMITTAHRAELYHSLMEIAESIVRVYGEIIPDLVAHLHADSDIVMSKLFDLRDEFRHVESHILDAKLTDVEWPVIERKD